MAGEPRALDCDLLGQFVGIGKVGVHGQLHEVCQLASLERAELVVAPKAVGRVDGVGAQCMVEADHLLCPVHTTGAGHARDGALDVHQRDRRSERGVEVQRDAHPGVHSVSGTRPLRSDIRGEELAVEEITPVENLIEGE